MHAVGAYYVQDGTDVSDAYISLRNAWSIFTFGRLGAREKRDKGRRSDVKNIIMYDRRTNEFDTGVSERCSYYATRAG
jgi:hypothetical protein